MGGSSAVRVPRGDHYYRCADHTLWAQRVDGLLRSARSGEPLVYQHGTIFYDPVTRQPLYYESPEGALLGRTGD